MSHFLTLVVIEPETYKLGQEAVLEKTHELILPYCEEIRVELYKRYTTDADEIIHLESLIAGMSQDRLVKRLTDYYGAKAGKDETGFYHWTTYNPKSKWDWQRLGGRWDGRVSANTKEICDYSATAKKTKALLDAGKHPLIAEDDGYVTIPNPRYDPVKAKDSLAHNSSLISELAEDLKYHAIVTPDGEWHEHGHMGWFAIVSDEKDDWTIASALLLGKYSDHYAVGIDCHI